MADKNPRARIETVGCCGDEHYNVLLTQKDGVERINSRHAIKESAEQALDALLNTEHESVEGVSEEQDEITD